MNLSKGGFLNKMKNKNLEKTWNLVNKIYANGGNLVASFASGIFRGYSVGYGQAPHLSSLIGHYALPWINGVQRIYYKDRKNYSKPKNWVELVGQPLIEGPYTILEGIGFGGFSVASDWLGFGLGYAVSKF